MGKRGPQPRKGATLGARISIETRKMLESAAKTNQRSMSEEAEIRLAHSLSEERTPNYWLLWAFADLVKQAGMMTGQDWIDDPFTHEVARQAIIQFFDAIRPRGEAKMPSSQKAILGLDNEKLPAKVRQMIVSTLVNPTAWGGSLASALIFNLRRAADHTLQGPELERLRKPAQYLAGLAEDREKDA
jgi:hypothetical protein